MNVVGLITEYNPFHNGHLFHLQKARDLSRADYSVAVMSGHFLQRGEPALFNKWVRAHMAVLAGVDLVIELPYAFSCRSAGAFAQGAVSILNATGVVSHLCFGSEEGDIRPLLNISQLFADEPPVLQELIKKHLKTGLILPLAQSRALQEYSKKHPDLQLKTEVLNNPNNILGIEYLKWLENLKSTIKPIAIKRQSAGYHDTEFQGQFASATSIREFLTKEENSLDKLGSVLPLTSLDLIETEIKNCLITTENFLPFIQYKLRTLAPENLENILDINEGLENRILDKLGEAQSFTDLVDKIKTKRYTWTRIQRVLNYILMEYKKDDAQLFDQAGPQYIRLLATSAKGRELLAVMRETANLPVITKVAPIFKNGTELLKRMLEFDMKASDIYTLGYQQNSKFVKGIDFLKAPVILD